MYIWLEIVIFSSWGRIGDGILQKNTPGI
jgi:hypothetical protein